MQHIFQRHLNPNTNRFYPIIALILISVVVGFCSPHLALTKTAKETYIKADKKYTYLKKNPRLQKYRDKWFACIDLFKDVYRQDPDGPWAAAGMYRTGVLYYELYKRSYKPSDKTKALDTLQRVIKRYPNSRYNKKAKTYLASMGIKVKPPPNKRPQPQTRLLTDADKCYQKLVSNVRKQKYRDRWLTCIAKYKTAHAADPKGLKAAEAIYRSGVLTYELYKRSFKPSDKTESLTLLKQTALSYPDSTYGREAEKKVAAITGLPLERGTSDAIQQVIADSKAAPSERRQQTPIPAGSKTLIQ